MDTAKVAQLLISIAKKLKSPNFLQIKTRQETSQEKKVSKFRVSLGVTSNVPTKGSQWLTNFDAEYFDAYGCPPPKKPSK